MMHLVNLKIEYAYNKVHKEYVHQKNPSVLKAGISPHKI